MVHRRFEPFERILVRNDWFRRHRAEALRSVIPHLWLGRVHDSPLPPSHTQHTHTTTHARANHAPSFHPATQAVRSDHVQPRADTTQKHTRHFLQLLTASYSFFNRVQTPLRNTLVVKLRRESCTLSLSPSSLPLSLHTSMRAFNHVCTRM